MNKEETQQLGQAEQFGKRIAMLLAVSDMPDDQKAAWAAIIPKMTFEQIDEFTDALSVKQLGPAAAELADLKKELEAIKTKRNVKVSDAVQKAEDDVAALMAEIDAKDQPDSK
jgi:hypothetical protein